MAIDKDIDSSKYQGKLGRLRRFFDTEVKDEYGAKQSLKARAQTDFFEGLFWNPTNARDNWGILSGTTAAGLVLGSLLNGITYIDSDDAVVLTSSVIQQDIQEMSHISNPEGNSYTILSRGFGENPYLLYRSGDQVFMFEARSTGSGWDSGIRDAEDMLDIERWEWRLLESDDAYAEIRQLETSLDEYNEAANDREAGFIYSIAPVTNFSVDAISVLYEEKGDIRLTTGEIDVDPNLDMRIDERNVTLNYISNTNSLVDSFRSSMVSGHYGFAEGQEAVYSQRDLDESTLNGPAAGFFGTIVPFYFLMGAGMGANRVRRRIKDVKKGKIDFSNKP